MRIKITDIATSALLLIFPEISNFQKMYKSK